MHAYQTIKFARPLMCLMLVIALPLRVQADNSQDVQLSEQKAVSFLFQLVKRNHLYPRLGYDCLGFIVENKTELYVDIAIREIHDSKCPGDPGVSPVVDRFRVMRSTTNVLWYDFTQDRYVGFAKARSQNK